jgi:hypothetical protein
MRYPVDGQYTSIVVAYDWELFLPRFNCGKIGPHARFMRQETTAPSSADLVYIEIKPWPCDIGISRETMLYAPSNDVK